MLYSFESPARGRLFHVWVGGCFVTALLLFGLSGSPGINFSMIYQLTGLALLVVGTYMMVRYVLKIYRYEITENGIITAHGEKLYDLVITEITGARHRVVTRVALRDIHAMAVIPRAKNKASATAFIGQAPKVYRYTNHPLDPVSCYLLLPEEQSVIVIPHDEAMARYLRELCVIQQEGE